MKSKWFRIDKKDACILSCSLTEVFRAAVRSYNDADSIVASGRFSTPEAIFSELPLLFDAELKAVGKSAGLNVVVYPDLLESLKELYQILCDGMTADYDFMTQALKRAREAIEDAERFGGSKMKSDSGVVIQPKPTTKKPDFSPPGQGTSVPLHLVVAMCVRQE